MPASTSHLLKSCIAPDSLVDGQITAGLTPNPAAEQDPSAPKLPQPRHLCQNDSTTKLGEGYQRTAIPQPARNCLSKLDYLQCQPGARRNAPTQSVTSSEALQNPSDWRVLPRPDSFGKLRQHVQDVHSVADSPRLEITSFRSTSSVPLLSNISPSENPSSNQIRTFKSIDEKHDIPIGVISRLHTPNLHFHPRNTGTFLQTPAQCLSTFLTIELADPMEISHLVYNYGLSDGVFVWAALVDMYARCGIIEDAHKMFDKMSRKDRVSWKVMIVGYAEYGSPEESLGLLDHMNEEGVVPDRVTTVTVAFARSKLVALHKAKMVHEYIASKKHLLNAITYNGMMQELCRALRAEEVQEVDIISAVEFDKSGDNLATGDKGGCVVIFEETDVRNHDSRRELERPDFPISTHPEFCGKAEFQSHEPEFDYLKSLEIEEKINKIRWCQAPRGSLFLLSTNDKTIKYCKVKVKKVSEVNVDPSLGNGSIASSNKSNSRAYIPNGGCSKGPDSYLGNDFTFPPGGFPSLRLPVVVASQETSLIDRCQRLYAHAHDYYTNSISNNSDGDTFISADDLRINLWHLEISNQSFNIVVVETANVEDLTEVIASAESHPAHYNTVEDNSSKGSIRLIDFELVAAVASLCYSQRNMVFAESSARHDANFDDFLVKLDAFMAARGDFGMEIPIENISYAQRVMIFKCDMQGKACGDRYSNA